MAQISHAAASLGMEMHASATHVLRRTIVIGLTAFLTVVDLFATQALLPSLTKAYHVTPAAMGLAVNASTLGMAVAGLAVALFSRKIDRRGRNLLGPPPVPVPPPPPPLGPRPPRAAPLRLAPGRFLSPAPSPP